MVTNWLVLMIELSLLVSETRLKEDLFSLRIHITIHIYSL